jgi:polysaccharide deacetylase family protein (PEP-CTERM system associated)
VTWVWRPSRNAWRTLATSTESTELCNGLSFDLEDWYQVLYFDAHFPRSQWPECESRLEPVTRRLLEILDEYEAKATFFVLGWNAERMPHLVEAIQRHGHEIGSHGFGHHLIYRQGREAFTDDLGRSLRVLQNITGLPIKGFRAPSFSITRESTWALSVLLEHGIVYDSSVLPARRPYCGIPGAPTRPWRFASCDGRTLVEAPPSTLSLLGWKLPFGGGGYFRLLPYPLVRLGLRRANRAGIPAVIYLHPWELDPAQPRVPVRWRHRFQHYVNLDRTEAKLKRLLGDFKFVPFSHMIESLRALPVLGNDALGD